jgi:two-component system, OmpR family, phosphate regulon sensor histidine kinase PhoR
MLKLSLRFKLIASFMCMAAVIAGVAYHQSQHHSPFGLYAILLSLALAFLIGLLIASVFARSINDIKASAQRMANGDFSQSLKVGSRDELGELAGTFNQMSDRLRESYQRLALEKQRDEALLGSMSEGLIAVDKQGKIVLINNVAVQLLELPTPQSLIGSSLFDVAKFHTAKDAPLPKMHHPAAITLEKGKANGDVFTFHHKDATKILINVNANPVLLEGEIAGAIIVLRDVTKEKEIDRMKTEFISLASHQLRTPLSAIKWYTEMLLSADAGKLNPDQNDFAQNIYDSSERMIELVNSLLNISRIESGRIIVDPKPTDLKELVSGIIADLKAKTEEHQQTLVISVHRDLPKINLDPRLIGQVYMNLLTNAIKYTPKGGEISVFISKKGNQVLSQVTDNGYGIPKSQHDKVFQKFFRAENIVKVETDGTGLGLYLIKAIIESSGGKIWFDSEEGKGTTFWFTLPLSGMKPREGEVTLDA